MTSGVAYSRAPEEETIAEKNAKHFDKVAPGQWPEWVLDLHRQIADFLSSPECPKWLGIPSSGDGRRMLDYACGDGLITRALKPLFSSAIGIDLSASMLEKYRETASRLGVGPGEMMGVRGDLLVANAQPTDPALPDEVLSNFDLVAISMALHHVEDPDFAIERLAARLKTGGKLLVVDWAPLDGSTPAQREYQEEMRQNLEQGSLDNNAQPHASSHTISRPNGFTEQEMTQLLEIAGCKDVKWKLAEELSPIPVIHTKAQLYWAIATKA